jgi:hypothetical protein
MQSTTQRPAARNFFAETQYYIRRMTQLADIASLNERRNASHPLFHHLRWLADLMNRQVSEDGRLMVNRLGPGEHEARKQLFEILAAQCAYGYDRMYWLSDRNFENLVSNAGNRKFIYDRLRIPEMFDATISELFY